MATKTTTTHKAKTYSTFYLVMLILSTISTALGILMIPFSILDMPNTLQQLGILAFTFSILDIVALALGAMGLYFLWAHQYKKGIWLVIIMYAQTALSAAVAFLYVNPMASMMSGSITADAGNGPQTTDLTPFFTTGLYIAMGVTLVISAAFISLWWGAYSRQLRHAGKKS